MPTILLLHGQYTMQIQRHAVLAFVLILALGAGSSRAGRPLSTDDTATAEAGQCQVESWLEQTDGRRGVVAAPACGLQPGLEAGLELWRPLQREPLREAATLGLRWAPAAARTDTALGELGLGLKLQLGFVHPRDGDWRRRDSSLVGMLSLTASPSWSWLLNLGTVRDAHGAGSATLLRAAAVWTPAPQALLFAETQRSDRRALLGGTQRSAGARWWLVPERLGLDLTACREAASGNGTTWTLGLGWYALEL